MVIVMKLVMIIATIIGMMHVIGIVMIMVRGLVNLRQNVQCISWQRALVIVASAVGETINKLHFCIVTEVVIIFVMGGVSNMVMRVPMIIDMEIVMVIVM